jgi:DNA-binding MarR family transcriptional regulator
MHSEATMKHYDEKQFPLTDSIGFLINRVRNDLNAEMDSALKDFGLTVQQMAILLALEAGLAATPFELAKLSGADSGLMTRLLDKLERRSLIERARSVEDRRVVNLTVTPHGKEVAARLPAIISGVLNARLREFSEEEFTEMRRLLRKFLEH